MVHNLKLYTFMLCPFAHRVRLVLSEKGLAAELIEVDLKNKPKEFSMIAPSGRVPVLQHGDVLLWESAVIMDYLDEAFPASSLMPASPADRAKARLWIEFANTKVLAPTHCLIFERGASQQRTIDEISANLRLLDQALHQRDGHRPFLMGAKFTLADIALYPWFEQLPTLQRLSAFRAPDDCANVNAWIAAVAARPAVKQCARPDDWYADNYRRYLAA